MADLSGISIDGKSYRLASESTLPRGAVLWDVSVEPSQAGDPSVAKVARWRVDGPLGYSFEGPDGYLGMDYGDNVDTRWDGLTTGPQIGTMTLSTYDASTWTATVRPVANYDVSFTPSAGSNYENVDDAVADDDATYNTSGSWDLFQMGTTGFGATTPVTKVTLHMRVRKTATANATTTMCFVYAPTSTTVGNLGSTIFLANNTTYQDFSLDVTENITADAWTIPEVEAARWGYRALAGDPVRVTQFYMEVVCSVPNACGSAIADGPNGERFLYIIRGKDVAKVDLTSQSLVNPGSVITLAENATSIVTTTTPSGTQEVSIGMEGTAYRVITTVAAAGTADTHGANADGEIYRILAQAPDRVPGLNGQNVKFNILSASTTMNDGNWQSAGILNVAGVTPTGFAALGKTWYLGTSDGPYALNPDTGLFEPLVEELGTSPENCRAMGRWTYLGVLAGTIAGLRYMNEYGSGTVGPEAQPANTSPVNGWVTALTGDARWLYAAVYNFLERKTYLIAGRPRTAFDPPGENPICWFPLATFDGLRCDLLRNLDYEGGRPWPAIVGGYGSNAFWITKGRSDNWREDRIVYSWASSGTWYGTELRRNPEMVKDLEAVEFTQAEDLAGSASSVQVGFAIDDADVQTLTAVSITGAAAQHRQLFASAGVPLSWASGYRIKPQIALTKSGAVIRLIGYLSLYYRERPKLMEVLRFTLLIDRSIPTHGPEAQQEDLLALMNAGPKLIASDRDADAGYWRITNVDVRTVASPGTGTTARGSDLRYASVTAKRWPQTSGD